MDQCKLEWRYCKTSHIHGIRLTWRKFINLTALPSFCFHNVMKNIEFFFIFNPCKIGHMDGIEQNVEM